MDLNICVRRKKSLSQEFTRELIKEKILANSSPESAVRLRTSARSRLTKTSDLYRRSTDLRSNSFIKEFGVFSEQKLKKLRVTVLPSNKKLVLVLPQHSAASVCEIEEGLRIRL